jgi:hypothetical protein
MSSISSLTSSASALPTLNIHAHGHKKGSHVGSADDSSSNAAAQAPAGTAGTVQNLFGTLLQSLEQVIGLQPSTATAATAATAAAGSGASATAATATTGATAATSTATASTQSASTQLQNYLNNLSQNLRAGGSQTAKAAGSTVRVDA